MEFRTEHDSMGEVKVPADKYWAAQTQRSSRELPYRRGYRNYAVRDRPRFRYPEEGGGTWQTLSFAPRK